MSYQVKKSIQQYSLIDLLEMMIDEGHPEYQPVKDEFQKRNASDEELEVARKGLEIRLKTRNKPLSLSEKIYCFLLPILTLAKYSTDSWSAFQNQQMDEFTRFGETRKIEELKRWQVYARMTYFSLIGLLVLAGLVYLILSLRR